MTIFDLDGRRVDEIFAHALEETGESLRPEELAYIDHVLKFWLRTEDEGVPLLQQMAHLIIKILLENINLKYQVQIEKEKVAFLENLAAVSANPVQRWTYWDVDQSEDQSGKGNDTNVGFKSGWYLEHGNHASQTFFGYVPEATTINMQLLFPDAEAIIERLQEQGQVVTQQVKVQTLGDEAHTATALATFVLHKTPPFQKVGVLVQSLDRERRVIEVRNMLHTLISKLSSIYSLPGTFRLLQQRHGDKPAELLPKLELLIARLEGATQSLVEQVQDAYRYTDMQAQLTQGVPEATDMQALAAEVVRDYQDIANHKGVSLQLKKNGALPNLYVIRMSLKSVLDNLIGNAMKYTEMGEVTVELSAEEDAFIIKVKDTGLGIDRDDLLEIFELGYRTATTAHIQGTGLGLHLVRDIVVQHDGRITVDSQPGHGSTFTVRLPLS